MAPRQTKQSTLEEINEILKEGLRPMLDLAPIFAHFEVELQRARDQLAVERGVAHGLRDGTARLEAQLAEVRSERDHAVRRLREQDVHIRELERERRELQDHLAGLADPQGSKRVSSLLELDPV